MAIPIGSLKSSSLPIAIIKTGDRQLEFVKIKKMYTKYFALKSGSIFEIDDEYEYKFNNTSLYFFNFACNKPLSLGGLAEVDYVLRKSGDSELVNKHKLAEMLTEVSRGQPVDMTHISKIQEGLMDGLSHQAHRFITDYNTDDEFSKTIMFSDVHNVSKKPVKIYSPSIGGSIFNSTPQAIIQIAHDQVDITNMIIHDKRAYTKYGTFAIDRNNLYWSGKQMICVFILNQEDGAPAMPLSKGLQKSMHKMIKTKQWYSLEVFSRTGRAIGIGQQYAPAVNITLSSEKALSQFIADSPTSFYSQIKEVWNAKEAVASKLSDPLTKAIPIILIFAVLAGFVLFISNVPPIIDVIAKYSGGVKYIIITKEQAIKIGIDHTYVTNAENVVDILDGKLMANVTKDVPPIDGASTSPTMEEVEPTDEVTKIKPSPFVNIPNIPDDVVAPVITVVDQVFQADNPNGMLVKYKVHVEDDRDRTPETVCDIKYNSILPVGDTLITCTSTDESGNASTAQFTVTVKGKGSNILVPIIPEFPLGK